MYEMIQFINSKYGIVLIIIFLIITLYPPFNWKLSTSLNQTVTNSLEIKFGSQLPIRDYDFIFNKSLKKFYLTNRNYKENVPLQRNLIFYELILQYLIAAFIVFLWKNLSDYLINKFKLIRLNRKRFQSVFGKNKFNEQKLCEPKIKSISKVEGAISPKQTQESINDLSIMGAYHLECLIIDGTEKLKVFKAWKEAMKLDVGDEIEPHLMRVWEEVHKNTELINRLYNNKNN